MYTVKCQLEALKATLAMTNSSLRGYNSNVAEYYPTFCVCTFDWAPLKHELISVIPSALLQQYHYRKFAPLPQNNNYFVSLSLPPWQ